MTAADACCPMLCSGLYPCSPQAPQDSGAAIVPSAGETLGQAQPTVAIERGGSPSGGQASGRSAVCGSTALCSLRKLTPGLLPGHWWHHAGASSWLQGVHCSRAHELACVQACLPSGPHGAKGGRPRDGQQREMMVSCGFGLGK